MRSRHNEFLGLFRSKPQHFGGVIDYKFAAYLGNHRRGFADFVRVILSST
jgi:hypothetical protein